MQINITVDDQFILWKLQTEDQMSEERGNTEWKTILLGQGTSDESHQAAQIPVAAGGDIVLFGEKRHDHEYGMIFATDEGVYTNVEMSGDGERWKCAGGDTIEEVTTLWEAGNSVQWPNAVLAPVMFQSHVGPEKFSRYKRSISEKMINGSAKYIWAQLTQGSFKVPSKFKVPSAACCFRHNALEPKHTGSPTRQSSIYTKS